MYRFRPCFVSKDSEGFTWLAMPGSLLRFLGVVYDQGATLVVDGTSDDSRPFGCFSCQERCTENPGECVCVELLPGASRECLAQRLTAGLTRANGTWRGWMNHAGYFNHFEGVGEARHVTRWDVRRQSFLVEMAPESSLPKEPPSVPSPHRHPPGRKKRDGFACKRARERHDLSDDATSPTTQPRRVLIVYAWSFGAPPTWP